MSVNPGGKVDADHLAPELRVVAHLIVRNMSGAEDFLIMVNVVHKGIKRLHPLPQACFHHRPLTRRNDARDDVEGDQALCAGLFSIDGKGNAKAVKRAVCLGLLARQTLGRGRCQPGRKTLVMGRKPPAKSYISL
jgi:hypothetical protein